MDPHLADKTIFYLPSTLDKERGGYVAGFMFRGRGAFRIDKVFLSTPDFLGWVRATMPKPYPLRLNEERMVQLDRLEFDCGLSVVAASGEPVVIQIV